MRSSETTRVEPADGGKRHQQGRLPKDWRAKLFETVKGRKQTKPSNLPEAIAVLWCTGCRPAELETGVVYMRHKDTLVIQILGAKHGVIDNGTVKAERGIESRVIVIDPNLHPGAKYLYDLVGPDDKKPRKLSYNKNSIRSRINEAGREVLANLKDAPSLSPYSFRHAIASDLRSCDTINDVQRAQVMGHLSVESLESYGRRRRGGGGVSPFLKVQTSAEPHGKLSHAPPLGTVFKTRPKIKNKL